MTPWERLLEVELFRSIREVLGNEPTGEPMTDEAREGFEHRQRLRSMLKGVKGRYP